MPQNRMRNIGLLQVSPFFRAELDPQRGYGLFELVHLAGADDGTGDAGLAASSSTHSRHWAVPQVMRPRQMRETLRPVRPRLVLWMDNS